MHTDQSVSGAAYAHGDLHDDGPVSDYDLLVPGRSAPALRPVRTGRYSVETEWKPYVWRDPARAKLSARVSQDVSRNG